MSTSELSNFLAQHGYPLSRLIHLQSMLHRHAFNSNPTPIHPTNSNDSELPSHRPSLPSLKNVLHSVQSRKEDFDVISPTQSPVVDVNTDAETDSDGDDSDSDSDAGSIISSSSSLFSSTESISSAATSVASSPCSESPAKTSAAFKARSPRRKTQLPSPVVDLTKKDVTKYLYQGGQTGVISGGTMLGRSSCTKPSTTAIVGGNGTAARSNWRSRD